MVRNLETTTTIDHLECYALFAIEIESLVFSCSGFLMRLLVIIILIITSLELEFKVFPQLTFVVVFVPFGHASVKESLEDESTTEDSGNINRVSLKQGR